MIGCKHDNDAFKLAENYVDGILSTWKQDIKSNYKYLYDQEEFRDMLVAVCYDSIKIGYNVLKNTIIKSVVNDEQKMF